MLTSSLPRYTGKYPVGVVDVNYGEIVARLFYPSQSSQNSQVNWLSNSMFGQGYAWFLKTPKALGTMIFGMMAGREKLDAKWGPPLASNSKKFPLIIFSHGLGGCRNTYTSICGELSSHGSIVVAIESGDGSACVSLRDKDMVPRWYDRPTSTDNAVLWPWRNGQIKQREDEVLQVMDLMEKLNQGDVNGLWSSCPMPDLRDKIDFTRTCMAGHSFGGATTLQVLSNHSERFKAGIILDPWMFPLEKTLKTNVSLLSINSEKFHWKENLDRLKSFFTGGDDNLYVTIKNTAHQNQSDLPLIAPNILQMTGMSGTMKPARAIEINNDVMLTWLSRNGILEKHHSKYAVDDHEHIIVGLEDVMIHLGHA